MINSKLVNQELQQSNKLQPGDLVFFANTYKKGISHTGIFLGNGEFISAKSRGILKANLNTDTYWTPKYAVSNVTVGMNK